MRTATWRDVPAVRGVLARAYLADPLMLWTFPEESTRSAAIGAWLGLFVEAAVAVGEVDVIDRGPGVPDDCDASGIAAVAVWRFPGSAGPGPGTVPSVAGLLTAIVGSRHAVAVGQGLAELRPLSPLAPSAYVQFLAVDPTRRRAGLGRSVLARGLRRAEAAGLGVHLETANADARPFYRAQGFTETAEVHLPTAGPTVWALARNPGRGDPAATS